MPLAGLLLILAGSASTMTTNSLGLKLADIPAGEFVMGSRLATPPRLGGPRHLPTGDWDEWTVRRVTISRPFAMSVDAVTVAQFRAFRPGFAPDAAPDAPAAGVTWDEAVAFCAWLSAREGETYRLPTEAEWEYACRAGTSSHFATGDPPTPGAANAWGLRGLHELPAEWCADRHGRYPEQDETDPVGPASGIARVVRGGGLQDDTPYYARSANRGGMVPDFAHPRIGFRVVRGEASATPARPVVPPLAARGVLGETYPDLGPGDRPWYRARAILPVPPENTEPWRNAVAGFELGLLNHNHSPALEVCANGDVLAIYYTAPPAEYTPDVALMAVRLRRGADEWDPPELLFDLPDVNDHAPCLWRDGTRLHLFWGGPGTPGVAFRWTWSDDHGVSWSPVRLIQPVGEVGPYSPQPINSAFRGVDGTIYLSSDAEGPTSLLWASADDGATWFDTGGRSAGRHTTYVELRDGAILGIGGKNTDVAGLMPQAISRDGGRTWERSVTPFAALKNNQRPQVIRLASGRLCFCGDFQDIQGNRPPGREESGAFVALSDDDGRTWPHQRRLPDALPHENQALLGGAATIGYSAMRQGPDQQIHLITSMNTPSQHFEFNEAWILGGEATPAEGEARRLDERFVRAADGRVWLDGGLDADGWTATFRLGRRVGPEVLRYADGSTKWLRQHDGEGGYRWWTWWADGKPRTDSTWRGSELVHHQPPLDPNGAPAAPWGLPYPVWEPAGEPLAVDARGPTPTATTA